MCRSSERNTHRADAGFTLIEALAALAVVAVSLAAIASLVATSIRGTVAADERLSLLENARATLTALPDRGALAPGNSTGELANNRWRIDVLPFAADFADPSRPTRWVPRAVILRLESPSGAVLRLDTVRLQRAEGSRQ